MSRLKRNKSENVVVGSWAESATKIQFCPGWSGQGSLELGSLSPSAEGLSSSLFLLAGGGTGSTKKLAVDILGSPPTLDFKLLHQMGTVGASEDWRDPFCPSFQGCTENSQVPFGIGKGCPKFCRSLEWALREGGREAVMCR